MSEETLFANALEKPPAERNSYLLAACAGDDALRRRVEALLAAHDPADRFLEVPAVANGRTGDYSPDLLAIEQLSSRIEKPGTRIGPYKLLQQIGEGGMGIVYMAEQEHPVRRRVALKIVKPGMDTVQVIARFEAERQALALMNHQNIAQVLDVGATESGRPYFVMELVNGIPITKYCDHEKLTPRERLELFVPVCQAVQHAHQKGIIHRDLKPANVLIALFDGKPVPKVIDFGVAKAMSQRLTERTMFTEFGQVIGTLEYMSPEQAERNALDVDTRSDIYSLGVLLYELLTGTTPLDKKKLHSAAFNEMLRMIREEEPAKPSTRLSQSGEALPAISAQRKTEPATLPRLMRGELDWIVMKCLEKDRSHRYETANGLARDIQRHLNDERVEACPPTIGYRLRKFLHKNKRPVAAAGVTVFALVAGIIVSTWGFIEARHQQQVATQQAANSQAINDFLLNDLLGQADPDMQPVDEGRDPDVKVRTLLDRAAQGIAGRFADQPLTEAAIRSTLAKCYLELGYSKEALPHAQRAAALRLAAHGPQHNETLRIQLLEATAHYNLANYEQAESLCQQSLRHVGGRPNPIAIEANKCLALVYRSRSQLDRAVALYQNTIRDAVSIFGHDHAETQEAKHGLAAVYVQQQKYDLALPLFQEVSAWRTRQLGRNHRHTMNSLHGLAATFRGLRKLDQAESVLNELIESASRIRPDHPNLVTFQTGLGLVYFYQGQFDKAEPLQREALRLHLIKFGSDHPNTFSAKNNLATTLDKLEKYDECGQLLHEVVEGRRRLDGLAHIDTQKDLRNLINIYEKIGRHDLATPICNELIEFWRRHPNPILPMNTYQLIEIGVWLIDNKRPADAELVLRTAFIICQKNKPENWVTPWAQVHLGRSLLLQKKYADAEPQLIQALEELKQKASQMEMPYRRNNLVYLVEHLIRLFEETGQAEKAAKFERELEEIYDMFGGASE